MLDYTYTDVAKMIDHSLLNPTLTLAAMDEGIQLAIDYDAASVCILPYVLRHAANKLMGTAVKASTTNGFPPGRHPTAVKHVRWPPSQLAWGSSPRTVRVRLFLNCRGACVTVRFLVGVRVPVVGRTRRIAWASG